MLVVRERLAQPQDVLARVLVETVKEDCVGRPVICSQLQFGIVRGHVAIVSDAQFRPTCRTIFMPSRLPAIVSPPGLRFPSPLATHSCNSMDAAPRQKDPLPPFSAGSGACR